jgi:hypothetical protein
MREGEVGKQRGEEEERKTRKQVEWICSREELREEELPALFSIE